MVTNFIFAEAVSEYYYINVFLITTVLDVYSTKKIQSLMIFKNLSISMLCVFMVSLHMAAAQSKKELKAELEAAKVRLTVLEDSLTKENTDFNINMHQISYALALNIASNIKQQGFIDSLHIPSFQRAFYDVRNGEEKMEAMEAGTLIKTFINEMSEKRSAALRADGEAFLAKNKMKEGVTTLPSGLQYEIINEGEGESPSSTDRVKVHYEGKLTDGSIFDSSYKRGEPIVLSVNGVIAGWTEALQLMKPGAKWKLFIPYDLAYGERGAGGDIPPYATLIFDVELISIE